MAAETAVSGMDPDILKAVVERVWGKETTLRFRFESFEAALGDLRVVLDGDLRVKVVLGRRGETLTAASGPP